MGLANVKTFSCCPTGCISQQQHYERVASGGVGVGDSCPLSTLPTSLRRCHQLPILPLRFSSAFSRGNPSCSTALSCCRSPDLAVYLCDVLEARLTLCLLPANLQYRGGGRLSGEGRGRGGHVKANCMTIPTDGRTGGCSQKLHARGQFNHRRRETKSNATT